MLALSILSTWLITVTFQILLIDIAKTFSEPIGTTSMTASVGAISGAAFGLLMSVLSVRFNHKLFLLIGLGCTCLAALGFYVAPNFTFVLIPNIGVGAGIAMVTGMAYAIIGEHYPLQGRGRAVGVLVGATALAYIVGGPTIGLIASTFGDWRPVMLLLSLPFALASLILALIVVPNKNHLPSLGASALVGSNDLGSVEKEPFLVGCKLAFTNRSTIAALAVTMFMLCESAIGYYSVTFFRDQFQLSIMSGSYFVLIGNVLGAIGGFVSGLLVNRVGRKRLGTITCVMAGVLTLSFAFMPTVELSYGLGIVRFWFSSMAFTAGGALILEQLPKFRSTMTSLNAAFMNFGMLLASLVAGMVLNIYNDNYQLVGIVLGSLGILGAVVWVAFVKEPVAAKKT